MFKLMSDVGLDVGLQLVTVLQAFIRVFKLDRPGIRTPVAAVKGQCPRPLDDGT